MKLSEAIPLGSTVVTPKAGVLYSSERNVGCAIGMAMVAEGAEWSPAKPGATRTQNTELWWPWTTTTMSRPCGCWLYPRKMSAKEIIAHLFDKHVMRRKDWTLDQLVEWVRSVEPPTPILPDGDIPGIVEVVNLRETS